MCNLLLNKVRSVDVAKMCGRQHSTDDLPLVQAFSLSTQSENFHPLE